MPVLRLLFQYGYEVQRAVYRCSYPGDGIRQEYIGGEPLDTIYFGGGTPSQLQQADFERIFEAADRLFGTSSCTEITLEANPDDMTPEYVASLRNLPFNRISMGVQSFKEKDLRFLNRRHNREQALRAVGLCKENGIQNISIDLIYGLPDRPWKSGKRIWMTRSVWKFPIYQPTTKYMKKGQPYIN